MSSSSTSGAQSYQTRIPLFGINIDVSGKLGLQKQIRAAVVDGILSGKFPAGARLPASRSLAQHLGVSRLTVTLAYHELAEMGYLERLERSGFYIAQSVPAIPETPENDEEKTPPEARLVEHVDYAPSFAHRFVSERKELRRPENWRDYPYPFIYGQADPALIDHHGWRQCSLEALGKRDFDALTLDYYERDDPLLVENILRLTLPKRGIYAEPDELLITMGAQNALWLTVQLFLGQGRRAVIENPCYPALRKILQAADCALDFVDVDHQGLDPEKIGSEANVVFTTPSHQSPSNVTMPLARRKALLARAKADDFLIVEDDYESENAAFLAPTPALKSLDRDGQVVYIGSFSKSLFPALRIGYMVASREIIQEARALRGMVFRHPPALAQRTVAYFQSLGHYDRQIQRIGQAYRKRREEMMAAIEAHGLRYAVPPTVGGSSLWMKTPKSIDSEKLATALLKKGVVIEPGHAFYHHGARKTNRYRLAYSSIDSGQIHEGIARIKKACDAL